MLLTKEDKKIEVILKWTIDLKNCNNNILVILNKLNQSTVKQIGDGCYTGHIRCDIGITKEGGMWDHISLYTNEKVNNEYALAISDGEVLDIAKLCLLIA